MPEQQTIEDALKNQKPLMTPLSEPEILNKITQVELCVSDIERVMDASLKNALAALKWANDEIAALRRNQQLRTQQFMKNQEPKQEQPKQ